MTATKLWKDPPCLIGESTINGDFQQLCKRLPVGNVIARIINLMEIVGTWAYTIFKDEFYLLVFDPAFYAGQPGFIESIASRSHEKFMFI